MSRKTSLGYAARPSGKPPSREGLEEILRYLRGAATGPPARRCHAAAHPLSWLPLRSRLAREGCWARASGMAPVNLLKDRSRLESWGEAKWGTSPARAEGRAGGGGGPMMCQRAALRKRRHRIAGKCKGGNCATAAHPTWSCWTRRRPPGGAAPPGWAGWAPPAGSAAQGGQRAHVQPRASENEGALVAGRQVDALHAACPAQRCGGNRASAGRAGCCPARQRNAPRPLLTPARLSSCRRAAPAKALGRAPSSWLFCRPSW